MTNYLKRFVSLRVRCQLTLKDLKGNSGKTLFGDFHQIYLFLIDVMRAGYQECGKDLNVEYAHTALRTVWGRSKQLRKEEKNRISNKEKNARKPERERRYRRERNRH